MLALIGSAQVCDQVQGRSPLRIGVLAPGQKAGLPVRPDHSLVRDRGSDSSVSGGGSAPETLERQPERRGADPPAQCLDLGDENVDIDEIAIEIGRPGSIEPVPCQSLPAQEADRVSIDDDPCGGLRG